MFGLTFGGATAYPRAKGIWRDEDRGGALVNDEPVVVHCYTTPAEIENAENLAELGTFCWKMGREARHLRECVSLEIASRVRSITCGGQAALDDVRNSFV